ncbi:MULTISPECIES: LysR family transcriptional regulator [unclassified Amycolatopsis]|uniref:LysR family transcriptional regulator n=1 Tax=unclassified Amycolatopsis TaxID=2618356 RepID=UPI000564FC8E|nr:MULTISPECIES: LysR family transcriptional regulator [unclassified Amycolatopsis]MCG3754218.1 LysR family transcriptional regulator [Amycolatopsis sp. Poz14]
MPGYTLRQLEYFAAVAEAKSISAAAAELHVTPTAVASALTELERVLRTQLVVRRKAHGITLTPTGQYLRERIAGLLRDADELERAAAGGGRELAGPLALGCYSTVAPTVVPILMEWVRDQHPRVDLSVVTGSQAELPQRLLAGGLDVAVGYDMALPDGLDSVPLYSAPPYALLPAAHRLAGRDTVRLAELADDPMIMLDFPPAAQHTRELYERAGIEPRVAHRTADFELTRSLVARGFGYSVLIQRPTVNRSYEDLPLALCDLEPAEPAANVVMMWPREVRLNDRAAALVEFAARNADRLDPRRRA